MARLTSSDFPLFGEMYSCQFVSFTCEIPIGEVFPRCRPPETGHFTLPAHQSTNPGASSAGQTFLEKNNTYLKKKADYVRARSVHEGAVVGLFVRTFTFLPSHKHLCAGMPTNDPPVTEFELFLWFDFSNL